MGRSHAVSHQVNKEESMRENKGTANELPAKGNMSPYIVGLPSKEEVAKSPPKEGDTATDDLGCTWGETKSGVIVRHK